MANVTQQLQSIQQQMHQLLEEARWLLRDSAVPRDVRARAEAYWVPAIACALSTETEWLSSSHCIEKTIEELGGLEPEGEDEESEEG